MTDAGSSPTRYLRRFSLYEPVDFVRHFLLDKLDWTKVRDSVAVHVPCSSKKMGLADAFTQVASLCAHEVTHTGVPCCGALIPRSPSCSSKREAVFAAQCCQRTAEASHLVHMRSISCLRQ